MVLQQLTETLPPSEQAAGVRYGDDPRSLARMATRAEMRQPGTLERTFSGIGAPGMGMGMGMPPGTTPPGGPFAQLWEAWTSGAWPSPPPPESGKPS
jgi:hypothetical protein